METMGAPRAGDGKIKLGCRDRYRGNSGWLAFAFSGFHGNLSPAERHRVEQQSRRMDRERPNRNMVDRKEQQHGHSTPQGNRFLKRETFLATRCCHLERQRDDLSAKLWPPRPHGGLIRAYYKCHHSGNGDFMVNFNSFSKSAERTCFSWHPRVSSTHLNDSVKDYLVL